MPRRLALATAIIAAAAAGAVQPAPAQSTLAQSTPAQSTPAPSTPAPPPAPSNEELRLPERMDRALRDMMEDMEPTIDELLDSLGPALEDALDYMRGFEVIDDPRHYEMPEVLPNGDIIIRRRPEAPPFDPDLDPEERDAEPEPEGGIRT